MENMKIQILITRDFAITAIAHHLSYGDEKVSSKKKFKDVIRDYLWVYGQSNIDDHDNEASDYLDQSIDVVNKYWKP